MSVLKDIKTSNRYKSLFNLSSLTNLLYIGPLFTFGFQNSADRLHKWRWAVYLTLGCVQLSFIIINGLTLDHYLALEQSLGLRWIEISPISFLLNCIIKIFGLYVLENTYADRKFHSLAIWIIEDDDKRLVHRKIKSTKKAWYSTIRLNNLPECCPFLFYALYDRFFPKFFNEELDVRKNIYWWL